MTLEELNSMTVLQLRKVARENDIVLGAGVDKLAILNKIAEVLLSEEDRLLLREQAASAGAAPVVKKHAPVVPEEAPAPEEKKPAPAPAPVLVRETPAAEEEVPAREETSEPKYQAAWHSPDSPHSSVKTSGRTGGGNFISNRPAWQSTTPSGRPLTPEQRPQPLRPASFAPRFGPGPAQNRETVSEPTVEAPSSRPVASPLPDHRVGFAGTGSFSARPAAPVTSSMESPAEAAAEPVEPVLQDLASSSPSLEELLSSGEFEEGGGVLELHPEGYGFLRSSAFLPSSKDIYVSMAQIRRFALRTGDEVRGKIRPQREGDKYSALLYIDTINGIPETEAFSRPVFEELTPVYPSRRISMEFKDEPSLPDMRLIDLIAPLGFGQRALLLCPPDTGKRRLLQEYAQVITKNYPDVNVLMLMIDINPEDVTEMRESVSCPVLASTFDQSPEMHLRLTEMVMERAMRMVEQGKDVVILADSLTRLAKIYTTSAVQQGRSVQGMVNPSSLLRAKKLFGAARACKEGGSLTVIATMDIATGSRVDDSVVEEFKGTANMELLLDQTVARAGVSPAVNLQRSYTKNSDLLLNARQKEGLALIRQMLGSTSSAVAIPQLLSMMDKAGTNADLLLKIKDWFALMNR